MLSSGLFYNQAVHIFSMLETFQHDGREYQFWSRDTDDGVCTLATTQNELSHVLILEPRSSDPVFRTRVSLGGSDRTDPMLSARTIADYQRHFPGLHLQPQKQYVEVGAGLGEPLVALARQAAASNGVLPKPIAIDPVQYEVIRDLLGCIDERYGDLQGVKILTTHIRELRDRCNVLLDPAQVTLIRKPLAAAVAAHPELHGCADVVVDLYGAAAHVKPTAAFTMTRAEVLEKLADVLRQEQLLLRTGGASEHWVYKPNY